MCPCEIGRLRGRSPGTSTEPQSSYSLCRHVVLKRFGLLYKLIRSKPGNIITENRSVSTLRCLLYREVCIRLTTTSCGFSCSLME